jgi:hypothetical protein
MCNTVHTGVCLYDEEYNEHYILQNRPTTWKICRGMKIHQNYIQGVFKEKRKAHAMIQKFKTQHRSWERSILCSGSGNLASQEKSQCSLGNALPQDPNQRPNRHTTWHFMMKALKWFKTSGNSHQMTQNHILKDWTPQIMPTQFPKSGHTRRVTPYLRHEDSMKSGPNNTFNHGSPMHGRQSCIMWPIAIFVNCVYTIKFSQ